MSFTGNPGTGKTTVALRMADILHRLGYVRKGHLVSVTRDDLVGQYIGHTAPKTKEILKKAMGGVLFIDEAYYLYRPENERDYGQESIEILLQVMENHRDDLVVILAGYADRMDRFFDSNPGFRSRIAHHIDFPDYGDDELFAIAETMLARAELPAQRRRRAGASRDYIAAAHASSRISPMPARSATRSTARGCARPTGCSTRASTAVARRPEACRTICGGSDDPGEPRVRVGGPQDARRWEPRHDSKPDHRPVDPVGRLLAGSATRSRPSPRPAPTGSIST